ncbi:acyltransferase family protein [Paenibacillus faecalis]|uniref:acyltransferase family protein n=1 Tax=Paenibacillus faecalis TaxID=2079532 RepID=UPI000D0EDE60|nr:acyltransferase family protein [Paenibacillus faecalis]
MPEPMKKQFRYMPGLDGLRALALFGVMGYHWGFDFAPGGFLGVSIFFVLSGYLITDILASQWRLNGRIDLKDFWYRRFRRLLPAMFVMLIIVVAWVTLIDPSRLSTLRGEVAAAVTYISNWQFIFQDISYFESFGPPSPLGHMWSLAVEEQFYLLWPLMMLLGLHLFPRRGQLFYYISALAGISAIGMALIYEPGTDPSRVYFGTDTRAFGLLIGSALAIIWPSYRLSAKVSLSGRLGLDIVGAAALFLVLSMMWTTDRYDETLYQGGMVILSIASAIVIAVLAHPASWLAKIIGCKPLLWIGVRSYGIYLWHYPIIILTSRYGSPESNSTLHTFLQIAASVLIASLSYKYIEQPIRHGALKAAWKKIRHPHWRPGRLSLKNWIVTCSTLIVIGVFTAGMMNSVSGATTPQISEEAYVDVLIPPGAPAVEPEEDKSIQAPSDSQNGTAEKKPEANQKPEESTANVPPNNKTPEDPPAKKTDDGENKAQTSGKPGTSEGKKPAEKPKKPETPENKPSSGTTKKPNSSEKADGQHTQKPQDGSAITAIGDSVMVGVTPYLEKQLPGIMIDAKIGRQMRDADELISGLKAKGRLDGVVIIGLGTNGAFAKKDLESLLSSLSTAKQVLLVNTKVPRDWEHNVNTMLAETSQKFPNTTLVDWYTASKDHPEYFRSDGVHLEPEGAAAYTSLIVNSIK